MGLKLHLSQSTEGWDKAVKGIEIRRAEMGFGKFKRGIEKDASMFYDIL